MNQKDIYDIIIENAINDWKNSMNSQNQREIWEIPKYSKSEINKAGSIIADPSSFKEDRDNALIILNNWRAAHAYPLQVICSNLRRCNSNAIVVQRLKRLDSKLATPISNGGLILTPPGYITGSARGGVSQYHFYWSPPNGGILLYSIL